MYIDLLSKPPQHFWFCCLLCSLLIHLYIWCKLCNNHFHQSFCLVLGNLLVLGDKMLISCSAWVCYLQCCMKPSHNYLIQLLFLGWWLFHFPAHIVLQCRIHNKHFQPIHKCNPENNIWNFISKYFKSVYKNSTCNSIGIIITSLNPSDKRGLFYTSDN